MGKIITFILSTLIISALTTTTTYAGDCKGFATDPSEIFENTPKAKFTINVGDSTPAGFSGWKIKFVCGFNSNEVNATVAGPDSISTEISNSSLFNPNPCEFSLDNPHQILVTAIINGSEIPQCTSNYIVKHSISQCTLDIEPKQGITSATALNISGKNLTPGGKFNVFVDEDAIDIPNDITGRPQLPLPWVGNVDTPAFGPKPIPQTLMTPVFHSISLRTRNGATDWQNIKPEKDFFGPALCSAFFTVGPPDNPGSFLAGGGAGSVNKGPFAIGGGQTCENDKNNPSIRSAIGCIHTNPAALMKDLLTFVIGISGGLAFLMMLLGAFQMVTSSGNPETLAAGKDRLTSAVIGLLFIIFAVLLLQIIGVGILGIEEFDK